MPSATDRAFGKCILCVLFFSAFAGCAQQKQTVAGKTLVSAQGGFNVVYATTPDPIPLNEPFAIRAKCTEVRGLPLNDTLSLEVDGRMPHHRHGMNREPSVKALGNGEFLIENMLFHMPGRWELYFDIEQNGITERAQDVVFLD